MEGYIEQIYKFCGISAFANTQGTLGTCTPLFSLKADHPFVSTNVFHPTMTSDEQRQGGTLFSNQLLRSPLDEDRYVWLWGTGECAKVISVSNHGHASIRKLDSKTVELWPAYEWVSMTPDLEDVVRNTSLRSLQTFFANSISGAYDEKLRRLPDHLKEMAVSLLGRIAPQKVELIGSIQDIRERLAPIAKDPVVLTAMAFAGDQRWILAAASPEYALWAGARAGRLFLPWADGGQTVIESLMRKGITADSDAMQRALLLSNAEHHLTQSERLTHLMFPENEMPPPPPEPIFPAFERVREHEKPNVSEDTLAFPRPPSPQRSVSPLQETSPLIPELASRRAALGYVEEDEEDEEDRNEDFFSTEPPRPLVRMQKAMAEKKHSSLSDLQAELMTYGMPLAGELTLDEAQYLLELRRTDRTAFTLEVGKRVEMRKKRIQEALEQIRKLTPDQLRFQLISAGLKDGQLEELAELQVDPLYFRRSEAATLRAQAFQQRTGIETFDARRAELQRRLAGG